MGIVDFLYDRNLIASLLIGGAVFAAVITLAKPVMHKDKLNARLKLVAEHRERLRRRQMEELQKKGNLRGADAGFMKTFVNQMNLQKMLEAPEIRDKLYAGGFRGQGPVYAFIFFRFVMPFVLFGAALFYLFAVSGLGLSSMMKFVFAFGLAGVGYYVPDLYVSNTAQRRQESVMKAFPDALDLLIICVESGMSIEAAFGKVAGEIGSQSVELSEELSLLTAELSYLPDRRQAYENLAKRCNHAGVKAVCTSLIQAERYGTPLGQALRIMAQENREMRMQKAEQIAASLPAKLTVPMILFFLPVLFVVILGPAIMTVMNL